MHTSARLALASALVCLTPLATAKPQNSAIRVHVDSLGGSDTNVQIWYGSPAPETPFDEADLDTPGLSRMDHWTTYKYFRRPDRTVIEDKDRAYTVRSAGPMAQVAECSIKGDLSPDATEDEMYEMSADDQGLITLDKCGCYNDVWMECHLKGTETPLICGRVADKLTCTN